MNNAAKWQEQMDADAGRDAFKTITMQQEIFRKPRVRLIHTPEFCLLQKGDTGYIDGYINGADNRPYAVVIGDNGIIDLVMVHNLQAANL